MPPWLSRGRGHFYYFGIQGGAFAPRHVTRIFSKGEGSNLASRGEGAKLPSNGEKGKGLTDGWTDGRTNRQRDRPSDR